MAHPPSPVLDLVRSVCDAPLRALVAAHRGDSQNAPENTLAAFQLAIDHGAQLCELDVHETADGDLVVIHDPKVDRTTDGTGEVGKLPTAALRELSAGAWFAPQFADERVPTLDEVLDLFRGRVVPLLEIKAKWKRYPHVGAKIAEALARHGMTAQASVICREVARVAEVNQADPAVAICYLTLTGRQAKGAVKMEGVRGVTTYWKTLSLGLVEGLREQGCLITPWTVNRARDMRRLLTLGVETIITDCPITLADTIETFEFDRADELRERALADGLDVPLGDVSEEGEALVADSDVDIEVDVEWLEEPPDHD